MTQDTIILIPSRLGSTRLAAKPLALIAGETMIAHVYKRALAANAGDVYVAAGDQEIVDEITKIGGKAVLTDPNLPSGTDRIYAALSSIPGNECYKYVVNLQGDMPQCTPELVAKVIDLVKNSEAEISTGVSLIDSEEEFHNPNVVKAVLSFYNKDQARALYFSRAPIPFEAKVAYHHLGIYGFKRASLERFVKLAPSELEKQERLEQLRAMEDGMKIDAVLVKEKPFGVDTAEDLEKVREMMS